MSLHSIKNPFRNAGRPRCSKTHLAALEYLLHPGRRPHGMFKGLVGANDITPGALCGAIARIKNRIITSRQTPEGVTNLER